MTSNDLPRAVLAALPPQAFSARERMRRHALVIGYLSIALVLILLSFFLGLLGWLMFFCGLAIGAAGGLLLWRFYEQEATYREIRPTLATTAELEFRRLLDAWDVKKLKRPPTFPEFLDVLKHVAVEASSESDCYERLRGRMLSQPVEDALKILHMADERDLAVESREREFKEKAERSATLMAEDYGYCYAVSARNGVGRWMTKFGESRDASSLASRIKTARKNLEQFHGCREQLRVNLFAGSKSRENRFHAQLTEAGFLSVKKRIENEMGSGASLVTDNHEGSSEYYFDLSASEVLKRAIVAGFEKLPLAFHKEVLV